jgi:hypothetical protein
MPPTIMVTVGRLAVELAEAEPLALALAAALPVPLAAGAEVVLLLDEQAATLSAVAHAAARAAREPLLRPIFCMGATPLLRFEGKEKREGQTGGTGDE